MKILIVVIGNAQIKARVHGLAGRQRMSYRGKVFHHLVKVLVACWFAGQVQAWAGPAEVVNLKLPKNIVMDFKAYNVSEQVGLIVSNVVRAGLVESGQFVMIDPEAENLMVKEPASKKVGKVRKGSSSLGQSGKTGYIILGEVSFLGGQYEVSIRVMDAATRVLKVWETAQSESERGLRTAARTAVRGLVFRMTGYRMVPPVTEPGVRQPLVTSERILSKPLPSPKVVPLEKGTLRLVEKSPLPSRSRHSSIVDPVRGQLVVFGGDPLMGTSGYLADTWTINIASGAWSEIKGKTGPAARCFHTATFDRKHDRMIVVGGLGGNGIVYGDTWIFDLNKKEWSHVQGEAVPPARWCHTAVLDSARNRLLVVGGKGPGEYLNDTWALDLTTLRWKEINSERTFPLRNYHSATFDPIGDQLVVIGGETVGSARLDDAWALDLKVDQWRSLGQSGVLPPRAAHTASLDQARNRILVVGGSSPGFGTYGDTWAMDLSSGQWKKLSDGLMPPRAHHTASLDLASNALWVVGGVGSQGILGDVWALNLKTDEWSRVGQEKLSPGRCLHTTDLFNHQLFIVGGQSQPASGPSFGDTWILDLNKIKFKELSVLAVMDFKAHNVSDLVGLIVSNVVRAGLVESGQFIFMDPEAAELIVKEPVSSKSGIRSPKTRKGSPPLGQSRKTGFIVLGEVSLLGGQYAVSVRAINVETRAIMAWETVETDSERGLRTAARQATRNLVLRMTGYRMTAPVSISSPRPINIVDRPVSTSKVIVDPPSILTLAMKEIGKTIPPRSVHTMTWDPVRRQLIVVGGYGEGLKKTLNDAWIYDTQTDSLVEVKLPDIFSPRAAHVAVYDGPRDRIVVYGGVVREPEYLNDTWELNLKTRAWRQIKSMASPPARAVPKATLVEAGEQWWIVGGRGHGGNLGDVWMFDLKVDQWREIHSDQSLPPRVYFSATLDDLQHRLLVIGGEKSGVHDRLNDVWVLDLRSGQWKNWPTSGGPPRLAHTAVFDSARNRIVVVAGQSQNQVDLSDAWTLDLTTGKWREIPVPESFLPRWSHTASMDVGRDRLFVVAGGQGGGFSAVGDIWMLDLKNDRWKRIETDRRFPSRYDHEAVMDERGNGLWIMGGRSSGDNAFGDLWRLNIKEE